MLFKLLIFIVGGYLLFNWVVRKNEIPGARPQDKIKNQPDDDEGEYVDYEEVD